MPSVLRNIFAAIAGMMVSVALVFAGGMLVMGMWPPTGTVDSKDPASVRAAVENLPLAAKIFTIANWWLATLCGTAIATRMAEAHTWIVGAVVGVLFLGATLASLVTLPHPMWMGGLGVAGIMVCAFLGTKMGRRASPTSPQMNSRQ